MLILALAITIKVDLSISKKDLTKQDIYYIFLEGERIANGENPYKRISESDMKTNDKYATYLPGFYCLTAGLNKLGLDTFSSFLNLWRPSVIILHIAIGLLFFFAFFKAQNIWLGLLMFCFWCWNRWSLIIVELAHIDFLPILLVLISLLVISKKDKVSSLLFGASLAFKHIAFFMLPIYLVKYLKNSKLKSLIRANLLIFLVPSIFSIPFVYADPNSFIMSLWFSITRNPDFHINVLSIDSYLNWEGIMAKFPMFFILGLIYFLVYSEKIKPILSAFLILLVFVDFNHVIFMQYFAWPTALLPLLILEYLPNSYFK